MIRVPARPASGHLLAGKRTADPFVLFAVEGALLQLFCSVNGFANNQFATGLGATDLQIGLIQTVPNVAALILLLPLGILADRLRSSRTIPLISLLCVAAGFVLMSMVPSLGDARIPAFFFALAFTVGGPALYNAQWQNFFGDVVRSDARNGVLTLRNRSMFLLGIATPLLCGVMMKGPVDTMRMYQMFFLLCALAALLQAAAVSGIRTPVRDSAAARFSPRDITAAVRQMAASREFRLFFLPVVLFYMSWQFDWSMWYIGQVQYLELTESQMTIYAGVFNIGQLVAIGFLSRSVQKRGTDRTLPFAALGLCSCPLTMMLCTLLPAQHRMTPFTLLVTVLNAPQCATNLCVVQILLRVAPRSCRSLAVSLFTLTTTLTNCVMPVLGVRLYTALGADYRALLLFNLIALACRIATLGLLLWRCRFIRK